MDLHLIQSKIWQSETSDEEDNKNAQMRSALSAIANEMQKFHNSSIASDDALKNSDIFGAIVKYKTTLTLKKEQIKILRQNLKTACIVAKTLSAAKASETASLTNQLNCARNQYTDLMQLDNEKANTIAKLEANNQILVDKLQCFNNLIEVGYKELQNVRNEPVENIPSLNQLQKIIHCCGQYYADHLNQDETCTQLKQRNNYLNSKVRILENQLETTSEELRSLREDCMKLRKKKEIISKTAHCSDIGVVCSEYRIGHYNSFTNLRMTKIEINRKTQDDNNMGNNGLSRHLNIVRKLLDNQNIMIKNLKCLSDEISVDLFPD